MYENVFPKDITPWSCQDLNPGPVAPDLDALTTRPGHPLFVKYNINQNEYKHVVLKNVVVDNCLFYLITHIMLLL